MATSETIQKGIRFSVEGGEVVVRELQQIGGAAERELGRLGPAAQRAATGLQTFEREATRSSAARRAALGNAAFQIQDIVVQLEAGTNPLRVLIQQGSQIAGAFGPAGAIIGALGAAALATGAALFGLSGETDNATESTKAFDAAHAAAQATLGATASSVEDLRNKINLLTDAQRELLRLDVRAGLLAQDQALIKLRGTVGGRVDELRDELGVFTTGADFRAAQERRQGFVGQGQLGTGTGNAELEAGIALSQQLAQIERQIESGIGIETAVLQLNKLIETAPQASDTVRELALSLRTEARQALETAEARKRLQAELDVLDKREPPPTAPALFGSGAGAATGKTSLAKLREDAQRELDQSAVETVDKVRVVQRELAVKLVEIDQQRTGLAAQLAATGEGDTSRRDALRQDLDTLRQVEQQYRQAAARRVALIEETAAKRAAAERKAAEGEARRAAAPALKLERADDRVIFDLESRLGRPAVDPREAAIFDAQRRLSAAATDAERATVAELAGALHDEAEAARAAAKAKQEGIALTERYRTAGEALAASEAELSVLLRDEAIDRITYERAVTAERVKAAEAAEDAARRQLAASREWGDGARRALIDYADTANDAARQAEEAVSLGLGGIENGLAGAAAMLAQGKTAWEDWQEAGSAAIGEIAEDLAKLLIRQSITGPLASALLGGFGGVSGGAGANDSSGAGIAADRLHEGGIAGAAARSVTVHPALFAGAPRYHRGGLAADEVPAVLLRGERVLSPRQTRDYDAAMARPAWRDDGPAPRAVLPRPASVNVSTPIDVKVIDQRSAAPGGEAGAGISVSERPGPDGRRMVEIMVRDVIASGAANKAMETQFGLRPSRSRLGR